MVPEVLHLADNGSGGLAHFALSSRNRPFSGDGFDGDDTAEKLSDTINQA